MGKVYACGVCVFCISVWGVIQLSVLAFFYGMEASTLVDDASESNYRDIVDYLVKTRDNYQKISYNCYLAAYAYVATIVASWIIIFLGKRLDKNEALRRVYGSKHARVQ